MRFSPIIAAICLGAAPALAQPQGQGFEWKMNDQSAPPSPSQASKDGFGVLMVVTDDPEGFMKAWAGPTPPHVSTTEKVTPDKPVETMLLFSGCRAAQDGNCDVSVELSITGPDGKPYGETLKGPIWKGPPAPQYTLQLGQSGLGFILEPQDKLGTYLLQARVTDHVAGTTLAVEQAVTAAKS
ncbi:MAG: hypothetical protein M3Q19_12840 [Pseudomonadota bacterium]|nr:hypothetical protein [Pseudomonadota bacterium]